ncbi:MAG: hypothetical protein ACSHX6_02525 [Akkermansiaceae bacterium]
MKFIYKYVLLVVAVAASGFFIQKLCYRFPTVQEMKDYHEGHYSTEIVSLTAEGEGEQKDGLLVFRAQHTNGQGFTERYKVEAGKAWVLPWETYWDSRARMKDDTK